MNNHSPLGRHFGEIELFHKNNPLLLANYSPNWRASELSEFIFSYIAPLWRDNGAKEKKTKQWTHKGLKPNLRKGNWTNY